MQVTRSGEGNINLRLIKKKRFVGKWSMYLMGVIIKHPSKVNLSYLPSFSLIISV